jgi:hypothetical protein
MDLERHLRRRKRRCNLFFNSRLMDLERHFPSPKGCFGSFFNSLLGGESVFIRIGKKERSIMQCISIILHTSCSRCGTPVPVNGLTLEVVCGACSRVRRIEPGIWKDILRMAVNGGIRLAPDTPESFGWKTGALGSVHAYRLEYALCQPQYPDGSPLDPEEAVRHLAEGRFADPDGRWVHVREFPAGLSMLVPPGKRIKHMPKVIRKIFLLGEDPACCGQFRSGEAPLPATVELHALQCASCGSPLAAPDDSRTVCCSHCGSCYILSLPLWYSLHPEPECRKWYLLVREDRA